MPYVNIRPVPGWGGLYSVTDDGKVWSHPRTRKTKGGGTAKLKGRWLKPAKTRGYPIVHLARNGTSKTYTVHRLIALAFIPNPLALPQINHIDGNRTNNTVGNLEWCTPQQNAQHGFRNGMSPARLAALRINREKAIRARKTRGATPAQAAQYFRLGRRVVLKHAAANMQRRADELAQP